MRKVVLVLTVFVVVSLLLLSAAFMQKGAEANPGYVGVNTCKGCHEDKYDSYAKSIHSKKAIPNSPANGEGCESCHGEGSAHVEKGGGRGTGIFNFNPMLSAKEKSAKCLACHEDTKYLAFWNMSKHKAEDVSCDNCHSIHSGGDKFLIAGKSETCYRCHKDIKAMGNKQSHHPIKEGKVSCTDCHDPHGEFSRAMIKADSVNELCYKCHAEKRGPFMWEHPPVEENCLNCHNPHGSNHDRLLVMKTPQLCQQCHDGAYHPGTPYTQFQSFAPPAKGTNPAAQLVGRACLNCHNDVHGTNGPSAYGQRFLK
ncbi:MAG: DmsE family decaheme c-type cytochrome [Thermodesulfovibrionales bacterium]|jgi:DmsE family decaheme c-type cytochrome